MGRPRYERKPCTWVDCVYYDEKMYTRCKRNTDGHSCLTFEDDSPDKPNGEDLTDVD